MQDRRVRMGAGTLCAATLLLRAAATLLLSAAALAVVAVPALAASGETELASVDRHGDPHDERAGLAAVSGNGRFVGFTLDLGFRAGSDVFVYDRRRGTGRRVSGGPRDRSLSFDATLSRRGRIVAFTSDSRKLVDEETDGGGALSSQRELDIFVHNRRRDKTELISHDKGKGGRRSFSPAVSADGRYVAFVSSSTNLIDEPERGRKVFQIFVYDRKRDRTERVSTTPSGKRPLDDSFEPSISGDGRYVAFYSDSDELVPEDSSGRRFDVFVHDRELATTELVSVSAAGGQPGNGRSVTPAISESGRQVAFSSSASDLVAGDANDRQDVFVRDLDAGTTELVSVDGGGGGADGDSSAPTISGDGRYVGFASLATDLITGDDNGVEDAFARDMEGGTSYLVSRTTDGSPGNGSSNDPSISSDGRFVAFGSDATDLTAEDGRRTDAFLHDLLGPGPAAP